MLDIAPPFSVLKDRLRLEKANLSDYPVLEDVIASVYAAFENYLRRHLEYSTQQEIDYQNNRIMVSLKALPIESITTITNSDGEVIDADNYEITEYGVRLLTPTNGKLIIDYVGGLAIAPEDLTRASMYQIISEYQRRDNPDSEYITGEGGSVTRPQLGLLKEVKRLLEPFLHPLAIGI